MDSTINLKIYDDDNSVIAEFETNRIRWGVLEDAIELTETLEGKSEKEAFKMMGKFIQSVFPKLTNELLRQADFLDVQLCFKQIMSLTNNIERQEATDEKNV